MPYIHGCKQTPKTPPTTSDEDSSGSTDDAEIKKKKGNRAMGKKKYPKAIKYYTKAIKIDPENPTYRLNRAIANSALELWKDAETDAETAVALGDEKPMPKGFYQLARAQLRRGRCLEAKQSLEKGLKLSPSEAALKQLSLEVQRACEELSRKAAASRSSSSRTSYEPRAVRPLLDQGRAAYEDGRLQEAETLLQEALKGAISSQDVGTDADRETARRQEISIRSLQGKLFMRMRRWQESADCFRAVVTLEEATFSPNCREERDALSSAYNNLGIALKNGGQMREAIEALRSAYLRATNDDDQVATLQAAQILQNIGQCHLAEKRPAEARCWLDRALEILQRLLGPNHSSLALARLALARALKAEGRLRDALEAYARALEIWGEKTTEQCLMEMPEMPSSERLLLVQQQCKEELAQLLLIADRARETQSA